MSIRAAKSFEDAVVGAEGASQASRARSLPLSVYTGILVASLLSDCVPEPVISADLDSFTHWQSLVPRPDPTAVRHPLIVEVLRIARQLAPLASQQTPGLGLWGLVIPLRWRLQFVPS